MTAFDPYHVWLGIPADEQPANYYRLLGLRAFEANADVIDHAADRQTAHLRSFSAGERAAVAQKLLNEVAAARVCLLDVKSRAEYDERLRAELAKSAAARLPAAEASVRPAVARPITVPIAAPVAVPVVAPIVARVDAVSIKPRRNLQPLIVVGVAATLAIVAAVVFRELKSREDAGSPKARNAVAAGNPDGQGKERPAASDLSSHDTSTSRSVSPSVIPSTPRNAGSTGVVPPAVGTSPAAPATEKPGTEKPGTEKPANGEPAKPGVGEATEQSADPLTEMLEGEIPSGEKRPEDEVPGEGEPDDDSTQGAFDPKAPVESLFGDFVKSGMQGRGIPERMPANRSPVPGAAALGAKEQEVRKLFAKELAQSKPQEVWEFARKLRGLAIETRNDDAARYALLTLAINQAIKAGDVETARAAANDLAMSFDVEWLDTVGRAVRDAIRGGVPVATRRAAIEQAGPLAVAAFDADSLPLAKDLVDEWLKLASQAKTPSVISVAREYRERVAAALEAWPVVEAAKSKLKASPEDAGANGVVGEYLCFCKADWQAGLAHLSKGDNATLIAAAAADLAAKDSPDLAADAGDHWNKVAQSEVATKADQPQILIRALELYARSLAGAGLAKKRGASGLKELQLKHGLWLDVLRHVSVPRDRATGVWSELVNAGVSGSIERDAAILNTLVEPHEDFEIECEFTYPDKVSDVFFFVPVGERACVIEIAGSQNSASWIDTVDGLTDSSRNPTRVRPTGVVRGTRYTMNATIRLQASQAILMVKMNGRDYMGYRGDVKRLGRRGDFSQADYAGPADRRRLGIGAWETTIEFHSLKYRAIK